LFPLEGDRSRTNNAVLTEGFHHRKYDIENPENEHPWRQQKRSRKMSKNKKNRDNFIRLYRRKLQNDLDDMGYLGGKGMDAGSRLAQTENPLIIDAGSELSGREVDSASRAPRSAVRQ
jgi:hypothetical protein